MTYEISKQIRIHNTEDDWDYVFTTDEYGSVEISYNEDLKLMPHTTNFFIPRDCIQHFIDALEQLKLK
jgi:hypothetical protein